MTTIQEQQVISAALTGATWVTSSVSAFLVVAGSQLGAIASAALTLALAFINHTQSATPTPATQATPATATPAITGTNLGPLPDGSVTVLGIYGNSASSATPQPSFACDVNQVPMIFADFKCLVTGSGIYSILIDGAPLKDNEEMAFKVNTVGATMPRDFWIPQKYRTVGTHTLTFITGNMHYVTPGASNDKETKFVAANTQTFNLVLTGVKNE